nr:MAG TPA: Short C-terminal domain [Caudoviricetes sp.]
MWKNYKRLILNVALALLVVVISEVIMYKARIEKLHKNGVITDEEYDNLVDIGFDDNGKLKPGVYKGDITTRYCLGFEPGKENLIKAVKNSEPWL